jgi:hypothetical protein
VWVAGGDRLNQAVTAGSGACSETPNRLDAPIRTCWANLGEVDHDEGVISRNWPQTDRQPGTVLVIHNDGGLRIGTVSLAVPHLPADAKLAACGARLCAPGTVKL